MSDLVITPNWPAPSHIKAYATLRTGGCSVKPFDTFNLAHHVGDEPLHVRQNRMLLRNQLNLLNEPIWLNQIHSTIAISATPEHTGTEADASFTGQTNQVCVVLTADCLPLLICNRNGTHVAAVHAGWRGLANGVIESTLAALDQPPEDLLVWLGPAISQTHYEVGDEVRDFFMQQDTEADTSFVPSTNQRWLADLYALARLRLKKSGIHAIYGGEFCTFSDRNRFYSYRRDGNKTGRQASLIWITNSSSAI